MLHFQLVSSSGVKYDDEAYEVLIPTKAGIVGIFEDHMPMISAAQPGVLNVRRKSGDSDSDLESFAINGGLLEVEGKNLRFMADDVTSSEEVSESEAEQALARAQKLVESADSETALHEAQQRLQHSSARLQVARL